MTFLSELKISLIFKLHFFFFKSSFWGGCTVGNGACMMASVICDYTEPEFLSLDLPEYGCCDGFNTASTIC